MMVFFSGKLLCVVTCAHRVTKQGRDEIAEENRTECGVERIRAEEECEMRYGLLYSLLTIKN